MDYAQLKQVLGTDAADRLENAVLSALASARTPEATAALSRLLACLTATVAHRAEAGSDIAEQCVSDLAAALAILKHD